MTISNLTKKVIAVSALFLSVNAAAQTGDKIVAVVDDTVITASDVSDAIKNPKKLTLNNAINQITAGAENTASKKPAASMTRAQIIEQLINQAIFDSELDRQKIDVADAEIDQNINQMMTQEKLTLDQLKDKIAKKGLSFQQFKDDLRSNMKKNAFMQRIIYPRIKIADIDLREYYRSHPITGFDKIRYQEILLTPDSIPADQNPRDFTMNLLASLKKGANFTEVAKKYSRGPFASNGGDSGFIATSDMRPEIAAILTSLKDKTISEPVSFPDAGIFIFKVLERSGAHPLPFEDVRDRLRQKLSEEKIGDELNQYLVEARARHYVDLRS